MANMTVKATKENRRLERAVFLLCALLVSLLFSQEIVDAQTPPYPSSTFILGINWDLSTHRTEAPGSDNWPTTWADDDHLYTSWGDGGGFGGTNSAGRVALGVGRIEGPETAYIGFNVWGGQNAENPATFEGKSYGLLSVDGTLYMWIMEETNHYRSSQIAWSNDHGATWNLGFRFNEPDAAFAIPTFLNFGKDYQGARDTYVYIYSGQAFSGCTSRCIGDHAHLSRVPKTQILDRNAYEFFEGLDANGNPLWTSDITQRNPVFADPNRTATRFGVVYNPGLGRYIMSIAQDDNGSLGIFEAPEPWGPWSTVEYTDSWLGFGYPVSYHIAPSKWMSADGKGFTMFWSSNDRLNTIRGTFILPPSQDTDCTEQGLLDAINSANSSGGDTIKFNCQNTTILMTQGLGDLQDNITIDGENKDITLEYTRDFTGCLVGDNGVGGHAIATIWGQNNIIRGLTFKNFLESLQIVGPNNTIENNTFLAHNCSDDAISSLDTNAVNNTMRNNLIQDYNDCVIRSDYLKGL